MGEGRNSGGVYGLEMSLEVAFPSLFSIVTAKEAWVRNLWSLGHDGGCWNPTFSCPFNDWRRMLLNAFWVGLVIEELLRAWRILHDGWGIRMIYFL